MIELKNMEKSELLRNVSKTTKIIEFALREKLGKQYQINFEVSDKDYGDDGLYSIMYVLTVSFSDPEPHLEIGEITYELSQQSDAIYNLLTNKKSSVGRDGLFGPYRDETQILGPSVREIEFNADIFSVTWIFEITIN